MRVTAVILCTNIDATDPGAMTLTGVGTDTFFVPDFPATLQLPLYVRLTGQHDDEEHHLVVRVVDSEEGPQHGSLQAIRFNPRPMFLPEGWDVNIAHVLGLEIVMQAPGALLVSVSIDGSGEQTIAVFVSLQESAG